MPENRLTDYEMLLAMRPAMRSLTPGSHGGSHTEVLAFESDRLAEALGDFAAEHGGNVERARETGRKIARRYLVKVGNIADYVIKLHGGKETVVRRRVVSEAFGNIGYNMAPTLDKVHLDTREAIREIPYFATGEPAEQFATDVLAEARAAVTGTSHRGALRDGVFLVEEAREGRTARTAYQVLEADPYFKGHVTDFAELVRFQEHLREQPLDTALRDRLSEFFDAPITVGVRDVLRYAEGSRHPDLGWTNAERLIRSCFQRFGGENFLPPEINYYTNSIHVPLDDARAIEACNLQTAEAFARWMVERLPFAWTATVSDAGMREIAAGILDLHFEYPVYDVEPYSGIFSTTTARFLVRLAAGAAIHATGFHVPERRNPLTPALASRVRAVASFLERLSGEERATCCNEVNSMLWEVAARGGVPSPTGVRPYRRVDRTFYSFQERAQWSVERDGTVEDLLTLEDLLQGPGLEVLRKRPEIARKLVVFFTLIYRYFLDTGHVPDLRPDDAGRDLFLKGIWGYSTKNVLVTLGRGRDGRPLDAVRFVDNKDQFKQYKRTEDRALPMGLAKYGMRLLHPLVEPAMQRSVGLYVARVAEVDGVVSKPADVPSRAMRVTNEVLRAGVDGALTHVQAFLHDAIDDTTDALERGLRGKKAGQ